ncbi:MAG: hypothetical protein E7302_05290 [Butyrivibrio sp.]|nr:hypothetical protein [Butyrivibrio sp.]
MLAIFKREFKSYLHSFIGPLFIAAVMGLFSLFYILFNVMSLSNNINGALYNLGFWGLMFMIPILCMRAFSEERKNKTDQMILTAPVSVGSVVLGKFLAIVAIFAIPTAVFCLFPLIMSAFGDVPLLWNYTSVLGFFLYGVMLIAVCVFISNLSDNPIICAVISIIVVLICNLSPNFYKSSSSELVKNIFSSTIDISTRMSNMMTGTCDLTSVIYFVSVTALFLLLTMQLIQKRRYSVSKKNFSISAYSSITVIIMIAAVIAANMAALQIPENIREADVTSQNLYTLSSDSESIVKGIQDDITLYFFAQQDDSESKTKDDMVEKILLQYADSCDHVSIKYIDPVLNPQFAKNYTDETLSYSSVIVVDETTGRNKVVDYNDMLETQVDYTTYSQTVTGYDIEGEITYALQYVCLSDEDLMNAYRITGHNEKSFAGSFSDVLNKNNMTVSDLSLLTSEKVPDDCELLIIDQPVTDYSEEEAQKVIDYLDTGKNALIITYYQTQAPLENFGKVLAYYGVSVEDGAIIENDQERVIAGLDPYYILPVLGSDDITSGISQEGYGSVFAPLSQGMTYEALDNVTITELLKTSDDAYVQYLDSPENKSETKQWLVGVKAVKELDSGSSTAVIYTSGDMFTEAADQMVSGNNLRLFGNTLNSLVTFDTELVTIPVKNVDSPLYIDGKHALAIICGLAFIVVATFVAGLVVWLVRRRK